MNEKIDKPASPNQKVDWNFAEFLKFLIITTLIVLPIRFYVVQPFIVNGESMFPTFKNGQYLIVDQISYRFSEPKRGDVVVFKFPNDPSKFFIKRIVALPNETIEIQGEDVFITNPEHNERFQLEENYIELPKEMYQGATLGPDEYFVMGDNRLQSYDSRFWGPLGKEYLTGRAWLRLFPFNQINVFPGKANYNYISE